MKIFWLSQLAGWLEGEGTFQCYINPRTGYRGQIQVRGGCTDADVIATLKERFGGHTWIEPRKEGWKTMYRWHIVGAEGAGLMMTVYPLMGQRRKEQIRTALKNWKAAANYSTRKRNAKGQFVNEDILVFT